MPLTHETAAAPPDSRMRLPRAGAPVECLHRQSHIDYDLWDSSVGAPGRQIDGPIIDGTALALCQDPLVNRQQAERSSEHSNRVTMFKCIIVAIDGSNTAKRALRAAVNLAKEQQAMLSIAHVVDLFASHVESPNDLNEYEAAVQKAGEQVLKRAVAIAQKAGVVAMLTD